MMMPRKKRRAILISIILVILIIIATICIVLYATTDMFKSNDVLFGKYTRQLLDNLDDILNEEHMAEMEEILNNNKLTSNTTATVRYNENGDSSNPINNIQVNISREEEKTTGYNYKDITVTQDDETIVGVEYIEDEGIAGVRLNGIRQYLSTSMDDGDENEIYNLYELIHTDIPGMIGTNSDEWNTVKEKYIGIIWKNIANATFSKQTGMALEINGTQYNTNVYSVTITKEQFNDIYIQILEELEKDEIILSKIEAIDNKLNEYHNFMQDGKTSNIKQDFIDDIDNTIQKIQNFNIGNNERTISVFESNGVAISLSIDTEEDFVGLDVVNGEGSNFINLLGEEKIENEEEQENSFDFKIEKTAATNDETIHIQYNVVEEGEETTNECNITRKMENSNIDSNIYVSRSIGQNTIEITAETKTNMVNEFKENEELVENENNIIIENLSDEQKENVRNSVEENVTNQINTFLQQVPIEKINQMLIKLNLMEEELDDLSGGEGTVTEVEKNRFNSTFELFEGENITKERIEELIDISKEDLKDVRITNYKEQRDERIPLEYRLVIERGTDNTELADNVIKYIEENYNEEFSVRLEYDDTTGLVNNIYITVMSR